MPEEISVNEITCLINTLSIIISLSSIAISYATYHRNKQRGRTMKCPDCQSKQKMIKMSMRTGTSSIYAQGVDARFPEAVNLWTFSKLRSFGMTEESHHFQSSQGLNEHSSSGNTGRIDDRREHSSEHGFPSHVD